MTVTSAINAIAHAVEGRYAADGNPVLALRAEEGIRAAAAAVLRLPRRPGDIDARSEALYAAWLCGAVLGSVSMGLLHKLCHTLGGTFDLPHADVHRSEEHTYELTSLMRISYAVFCLKKKKT